MLSSFLKFAVRRTSCLFCSFSFDAAQIFLSRDALSVLARQSCLSAYTTLVRSVKAAKQVELILEWIEKVQGGSQCRGRKMRRNLE